MSYLMSNYAPLEVSFVKGNGCYLIDDKKNKYLDALSGVAVVNLGHCQQDIVKAIQDQAAKLIHTSNWYQIKHQQNLAEKLCKLTDMDRAFFANSGAEANEAAIKISRIYANKKNIKNPIILTAKKSFHGRTMATLSATGNDNVKKGFSPLLEEFIHVDFNDINAIKKNINNENIVAVMLEPIQGESGVIIPDDNYLNLVRKICDDNKWLLILDEVQTGIARTGKLFAYFYNNITPDLLTIGKALGNGVPISACLAKGNAAKLFTPGSHGSTFGGNPLVCSTASKVLDIIKRDNIANNAVKMGDYIACNLKNKLVSSEKIVEIRHKGLMLAIELNQDCSSLLQQALDNKLLINITGKSIRLLPPLIINQKQADILIAKLVKIINEL